MLTWEKYVQATKKNKKKVDGINHCQLQEVLKIFW